MATTLELVKSGALIKVDPVLGLRELEMRRIYLLPRAQKWVLEVLPETDSDRFTEEKPDMQVDALIYEFCSGQPLEVGTRFKSLVHLADGIWELKTADVRLFGWFMQKDCFVVTDCDSKYNVMRHKMYAAYCKQAVKFRNELNIEFVIGDNPSDVVSDCYYSQ
jgi:hypothetical protein